VISLALVVALEICPSGAVIDRIEDRSVVVLGASGVHRVARDAVRSDRPHGVREGDRLTGWQGQRCGSRAPTFAERLGVAARIGQLIGRGTGPAPPRPRREMFAAPLLDRASR
jgi:hypothetical protein